MIWIIEIGDDGELKTKKPITTSQIQQQLDDTILSSILRVIENSQALFHSLYLCLILTIQQIVHPITITFEEFYILLVFMGRP